MQNFFGFIKRTEIVLFHWQTDIVVIACDDDDGSLYFVRFSAKKDMEIRIR